MFRKWIKDLVSRKEAKEQIKLRKAKDYKSIGITSIFFGIRENLENYSEFLESFEMIGDKDNNGYIDDIISECHELGRDLKESVQKMKRITNQTKEALKDVSIVRE